MTDPNHDDGSFIVKTESEPTAEGPPALVSMEEAEVATSTGSSAAVGLTRKASISEVANEASGGWSAPWWLSFIEFPFRVKNPKDGAMLPEAAGWAMDSAARGPAVQVGSFIGTAVLRLASLDAGCPNPRNCENTVRSGLKPSSLLTATSAAVGVAAAILMPYVGAIVDHTSYRKTMGVISALVVVAATGTQISISVTNNNWFFILMVDAVQAFGMAVHTTAVFAYLPDLTTDEEVIPHYTTHFNIRQFCSQFVFTSLLLITGKVRGTNQSVGSSVQTARDAAGIAFGFLALFFGYAWIFLFRKRPALSKVPAGQSLLTTGFLQVKTTAAKIWKDYHALKWFMISLLWSPEAGSGVVLAIVVSFLVVDIKFTGQDIAKLSLIVQFGSVLGSLFSKWLTSKVNPLNCYRLGLIGLSVSMAVSVALVDSPDKKNTVFGLAVLWGLGLGTTYAAQRVLFCTLIPKGQETEMMGLFTFTGLIVGWLPPLISTIMNENGVDLRFGLLVIVGFCLLAVLCTLPMGIYKDATETVARDSEGKYDAVLAATKGTVFDSGTKMMDHKSDAGSGPETGETRASL